MKIIPAFVSFFIATASAIEDPDVVEETVQISSGCRGVKWGKLTPAEEAYNTKALQDTYNEVHQITDGGDNFLEDVHLVGAVDDENDPEYLGGRRRKHSGGHGCRHCDNDDDQASSVLLGRNHPVLKAWANQYQARLLEGPAVFQNAKGCKISMKAAGEGEEELDTFEDVVMETVTIDVRCRGIKWNKATPTEEAYASKALQDTYNEVHQITDDGDNFLENVHVEGAVDDENDPEYLGGRRRKHSGGHGCRYCDNDDDQAAVLLGRNHPVFKAWANQYTARLLEGPAVFQNAKSCKISMKAAGEGEEGLDTVEGEAASFPMVQ